MTAFTANGQTIIQAKLITISPTLTVNGTFNGGTTTKDYLSGVNKFTSTSFGGLEFDAFCVEPNALIAIGQSLDYTVTPTSSLTNSDKVARLVGAYLGSSKTNADAAAIQWAIWEVTSENSSSLSLSNGNVNVSGSSPSSNTRTLGNQYLANINTFTAANITYLKNSQSQDMVAFSSTKPIPEPASLGMLAISGMLLLRRKRK